jgi:hypothetical protein
MARPKNKAETRSLTLSVPIRLHDYLNYLARNSILGASESEVASFLLTQQVMTMLRDGFHNLQIPDQGRPPVLPKAL